MNTTDKFMGMRFLFILLLGLITFQFGFGQSYTTKKNASSKVLKQYEKGLSLSRSGDFAKAHQTFDKLLTEYPEFIDVHLNKAQIYYDQNQLDQAIASFEKVLSIDPNYRPRAIYQLGLAALKNQQYDKAANAFEQFIPLEKRNEDLINRAKKHLANAQFAATAVKNPVPFDPQKLSKHINSPDPEFLPSLTIDGEFLIFNRNVKGQEDFFYSQLKDGVWQPAHPMKGINTNGNEAAQSISADGNFLVFTACNRKSSLGGCDLYFAYKKDDHWQPAQNIAAPINTKHWESTPSISANGRQLLFASNRPGGQGGRDLWTSEIGVKGWDAPINLGNQINTPGDEQSPFLHPDGRTLFFMSNGHPGMGNFDLYYSKKDEQGNWGPAINLGYPINTPENEGAMIVTRDGKTAYYSSSRGEEPIENANLRENSDLFTFDIPESARPNPVTYLKASVYDQNTKVPLQAIVEITDLESDHPFIKVRSDQDGAFLICIPAGKNYALSVNKKQYLFYSDHFNLKDSRSIDQPFELDIPLQPIPQEEITEATPSASTPVVLKNIFFETGSAKLLSTSINELKRLEQLLIDNPQMNIQINGHTDNVGSATSNQKLSEGRAKAVYDYLIEAGIPNSRLKFVGFGQSQPIASNETPEGRQQNRRTEFQIIN